MVCKNCGKIMNEGSTFCSECGTKIAIEEQRHDMNTFSKLLYDSSEKVIAVLGNNYAQTFLTSGVLGKGFAVLSDRRVYFKGKCWFRKGKFLYNKNEEKSVDLGDVTGTGFIHNKASWARIAYIISFIFTGIYFLAGIMTAILQGAISKDNSEDPIFIYSAIGLAAIGLLFLIIYRAFHYTIFEISYAGGSIAFNTRWIPQNEAANFQKNLNLAKDQINKKAVQLPKDNNTNQVTSDVPDQLIKYKKLLDDGIITEEEFAEKKKQLLKM